MTTEADGIRQAGAEVAALARTGALAGRWTLDPQASRAGFRVGHGHFWGAITVRGRFERLEARAASPLTATSPGGWSSTPRRWPPRTAAVSSAAGVS